MTAYADLGDLSEDDRIKIIATAAAGGKLIGFVVDDQRKANRYITKLGAYAVRVVDQGPGPVKGTILVRVQKES